MAQKGGDPFHENIPQHCTNLMEAIMINKI